MKKTLLILFVCVSSLSPFAQPILHCGADEMRISTLKKNPEIANAVIRREEKLEAFTKTFVENFYKHKTPVATYIIPVVFHVIHNFGVENISTAQILDGLDILNKTFRKQLADTASIVAVFKPLHADCDIEFRLATLDPLGNCTSGINRIASPLTSIGDHSVKSLIQWPPNKYLNIYIVANAAGLAGHCVWPADADSIPAWDGIVIGHNYVGSIGTSNYTQSVAFAHEAGHYLNLQHIWGGNNVPGFYYYPCADPAKDCAIDDLVADTPPTIGWVTCNLSGASCLNAVDNVQNTMDYSYCNRMFTYGQKARMQACLNSSVAGRDNLWQNTNLIATGVLTIPGSLCKAAFTSDKTVVCQSAPNTITFNNTSYNGTFTSVNWQFPGGTPTTSTLNNPVIMYSTPGKYNVTLKVFNGTDSMTVIKTNFISVLPSTGSTYPYTESFETTPNLDGLEWFSNSFDTLNSFQLTNTTAFTGSKCVMLDNFSNTESTKDELYSKIINLSGAAPHNISFKYAYAKKDSSNNDRLQLYLTSNCNNSWLQRINLIGSALETASISTTSFTPSGITEWKQASASIPTSWLTSGFRFKFVFTSNGGNNVYIDDINLDVDAGVNDLQSFIPEINIFPNPANEEINIAFILTKSEKLNIELIDVLGQSVYKSTSEFYLEGENSIKINTSKFLSGMYFIKLSDGKTDLKRSIIILPH